MEVRSVYAPFNGVGREDQLERRQLWDNELEVEMFNSTDSTKGRVIMGDMNAVYRDSDISPTEEFWQRQGPQTLPLLDRGFGGTTFNERSRFKNWIEMGDLEDSFTPLTPHKGCHLRNLDAQFTFRGQGKFYGKGMKIDYVLVDKTILISGGVKSSRILCNGRDREMASWARITRHYGASWIRNGRPSAQIYSQIIVR